MEIHAAMIARLSSRLESHESMYTSVLKRRGNAYLPQIVTGIAVSFGIVLFNAVSSSYATRGTHKKSLGFRYNFEVVYTSLLSTPHHFRACQ